MNGRDVFIKAAINGGRGKDEHAATPVTPAELATAAVAAVEAGADVVHFHPRRPDGGQSIDPEDVDRAITAVRTEGPVTVGITTGLWCCGDDPDERYRLVKGWRVLPDFASVAFSEEGAAETAALVVERGMVLESAVWSLDDVPALLASPTLHRNVRILIEPMESDPEVAVAHARAMAARLRGGGISCPLLYHGEGATVWPVLRASAADGHQIRIGLEDGTTLPDGSVAPDNVALLEAAQLEAGRVSA